MSSSGFFVIANGRQLAINLAAIEASPKLSARTAETQAKHQLRVITLRHTLKRR